MQQMDSDELYEKLSDLLHASRNTFAVNRQLMQKAIDVSWVEAIENGLVHVDNYLRHPMRTIEDVEEIVPIALSRKITVESVKHLAQHTDLIQSIDKKTGKITPSKILNVHKEESVATYENKFINTLIDRLYLFISLRYEKLAQVAKDEQVYTLGYDTSLDDGAGGRMHIEIKMSSVTSLDTVSPGGYTVWQRVEKLKKIIEGYKGSELCTKLGSTYIRPPVMRTNAIMKNVDLKACLALWQYIESYDKAGYAINIEDAAVRPDNLFVENFYRLVLMNLLLFRSDMQREDEEDALKTLKVKNSRLVRPRFEKKFTKNISGDYSVSASGIAGYIAADSEQKVITQMPENSAAIFEQINQAMQIEKAYLAELDAEEAAKRLAEEEEARRKAEMERIEAAKQAELERIQAEREEQHRRVEEMLAKRRAEQEAERKERERLEQERLAYLEEKRRLEEEHRKREEEDRLRAEEQERIDAERRRLQDEKQLVLSELGEAAGLDARDLTVREEKLESTVSEEEVELAREELEKRDKEFEDPREVAGRMKLEQQKREKERAERERAERLKAERQYFESKPFDVIRKEYSKNLIYLIPRLIRHLLVVLFGWVPENTDNPDYKTKLLTMQQKKDEAKHEKEEREKMEVYYRKYAKTFRYAFRRKLEDRKFRQKRAKEMRGKPLPKYIPPNRTPEERTAHYKEMQRLYKVYHVSRTERLRRWWQEYRRSVAG
ncbi:MAG: DUF2357 domain-containing protein [Oscillospiraceae bacterium]|nr:DUF2357 domain-containing protein [Oscillospiraceae bacterium]